MKRYIEMTSEERKTYHRESARQWRLNNNPPISPEEWARRKHETRQRENIQHRKMYQSNPDFRRKQKIGILKWRYGISPEQAEALDQIKSCQLCQVPFAASILQDKPIHARMPCIDHNHTTNKVRGILCSACNQLVGIVEKNSEKVNNYLSSSL